MAEPPLEGQELQEAVEAFLRSPMPASEPTGPSEPWAPEVTDAEEPTELEGLLEYEPVILFTDDGAGVTTTVLANDIHIIAIDDGPAGDASLAIDLAEMKPGCRVQLFGRWANVNLAPDDGDTWNGRMFVIERYEHHACPVHVGH
jgi:hypothetical protein